MHPDRIKEQQYARVIMLFSTATGLFTSAIVNYIYTIVC